MTTQPNNQANTLFLQRASKTLVAQVLGIIAAHYGTDTDAIAEELKDPEAEHLLEYMPDAASRRALSATLVSLGIR